MSDTTAGLGAGASAPARANDAVGRILAGVDAVSMAGAWAAVLCFLAILGLIVAEVAARNLFNYSLNFAWEFSAYFMGAGFLLGAAYALRAGAQIRVNVLIANLSPPLALTVDGAATLASAAICGYLAYALFLLTWLSWVRESKSIQPSELPLWIAQMPLALGAALLTLQLVVRVARLWRREPADDLTMRLVQDE